MQHVASAATRYGEIFTIPQTRSLANHIAVQRGSIGRFIGLFLGHAFRPLLTIHADITKTFTMTKPTSQWVAVLDRGSNAHTTQSPLAIR